jgi:fic/DOC family
MEVLSDVKHATVSEHIKNILALRELNGTSVGFSDKSSNGRNKKASENQESLNYY